MATRTPLVVAALAISVTAFAGYQYNRYQKGIKDTEQALQSVQLELVQTRDDAFKLLRHMSSDAAIKGSKITGGDVYSTLSEYASEFKKLMTAVEGAKDFSQGDVGQGISNTAKLTAKLLSETAKDLESEGVELGAIEGPLAKYGGIAVDISAKLYEARNILLHFAEMKRTQFQLEKALGRLQRADTIELFSHISQSLQNDQILHDQWLSQHNISRVKVYEAALAEATAIASPLAANEIAAGVYIIDPKQGLMDLQNIPKVNPDFIAAMQADDFILQQAQSDPRWLKFTAIHYPDGRYIPIWGPCLGIDIPNPFTGGIIASSTAACRTGGQVSESADPTEKKRQTVDQILGPYDPTTLSISGANFEGRTGVVARGDTLQILDASGKFIVGVVSQSEDFLNLNMEINPGNYLALPIMVGYQDTPPLPGYKPFSISVEAGKITVVDIPVGVIFVSWNGDPEWRFARPVILHSDAKQILGDHWVMNIPENRQAFNVAPGNYVVRVLDGGSMEIPGYRPIQVKVAGGQVVEVSMATKP